MQMFVQRLGRWSDPAQSIKRRLARVKAVDQLLNPLKVAGTYLTILSPM
jgi:hypothetical protein